MKKIKVGMVGARSMALALGFASCENVEITALCNLDEDVLAEEAKRLNVKNTYRVYEDMLAKETDIFPVDYPEIDVKSFTKEGVVFTATVTVLPEVKLGNYKGIEIKKRKVSVTAPEIEGDLKTMQEKHARFVFMIRNDSSISHLPSLTDRMSSTLSLTRFVQTA